MGVNPAHDVLALIRFKPGSSLDATHAPFFLSALFELPPL
jgi:hypothetical protein